MSISWFSLLFKLRLDKTRDVLLLLAKLFEVVGVGFFLADKEIFFFNLVVTLCCEFAAEVELGGVVWVVAVVVVVEETAILIKLVFVDDVCEFELLAIFFKRVGCWAIEDGLLLEDLTAVTVVEAICLVSSLSLKKT